MKALLKTANATMYRGGDRRRLQGDVRDPESRSVQGMVDDAKQSVREKAYPMAGALAGAMAGSGVSVTMADDYQEGPLLPVLVGMMGGYHGGKYYEQATR